MLKLPISAVKLNDDNPRTLKDVRFQQLIKSIQDFPQMLDLRPCVVDENHVVLGGNMRLRAMQHLGFTHVNVTVAKGLTPEQKREFVIKDNGSFGEWDFDALANGEWGDAATLNAWGMNVPPHWGQDVDSINEQDEWAGMPEFEIKASDIRVLISFRTEEDRATFCQSNDVTLVQKTEGRASWSGWWPAKVQEDLINLRYDK